MDHGHKNSLFIGRFSEYDERSPMEQAIEQLAEHGVIPAEIDYPLTRLEFIGTLNLIHR